MALFVSKSNAKQSAPQQQQTQQQQSEESNAYGAKVYRIYKYPANTVDNEPPATEELLMKQQKEIDESRKRTEENVKRMKVDLFNTDTAAIVFIVCAIITMTIFFGTLMITSTDDETKQITDSVSERIVNKVQQTDTGNNEPVQSTQQ